MLNSNNNKFKYTEDGLVNGAHGYIDSLQLSKDNLTEVLVVWVVFNESNIGRLLRFDNR